jgi:Protein of unknown function (DUF3168)
MSAETALYSRLSTTDGVTALVGTRIFPMEGQQAGATPYITYQKITAGFLPTMRRGALPLAGPHLQVNSWADTYTTAKAVALEVRRSLDGYDNGDMASQILDEHDLMNPDSLRKCVTQDYAIWTEEA